MHLASKCPMCRIEDMFPHTVRLCPGWRADLVPRPHVLLVPQYVDPARDVGALLLQRHHQVQRLVVKT